MAGHSFFLDFHLPFLALPPSLVLPEFSPQDALGDGSVQHEGRRLFDHVLPTSGASKSKVQASEKGLAPAMEVVPILKRPAGLYWSLYSQSAPVGWLQSAHRLVVAIGRSAVADPIASFWTADRLWRT